MYKICLSVFLICFLNIGFSQSSSETITSDSLRVTALFPKFVEALTSKDLDFIRKNSNSKVVCDYCEKSHTSINRIMKNEFKDFTNSKIYSAYNKSGFYVAKENFKVEQNSIYCVWIQTLLPDESEKGHEGGSMGFQFVKIGDEFKLFGLTSVP